MTFYIFSFNRGRFLMNCIQSIRALAPGCAVKVVDDHSEDAETLLALASLPADVEVMKPPPSVRGKHGRLYANMQYALDSATEDLAVFMQDDMQMVRPLTDADLKEIGRFFTTLPGAGFIYPCFLKGTRRKLEPRITQPLAGTRLYLREGIPGQKLSFFHYMDICIAHVPRLRQHGWKFADTELGNDAQAKAHFERMGLMADPFVMYLPDVPVYRGRRQTLSARLAAKIAGPAPKEFRPLTGDESAAFKARDTAILPFAEDFLECPGHKVKRPFQYSATRVFRLLHSTHKLELSLQRYKRRKADA